MGLDIYAVVDWTEVSDVPRTEDGKVDWDEVEEQGLNIDSIYQPQGFETQLDDIKNGMTYTNKLCGEGDFSSGYGSYSTFRDFLAEMAGYYHESPKPSYSDEDFYNKNYYHQYPHIAGIYNDDSVTMESDFVALIHFSDCEGIIANKWCKLLDKAFDKYMDKVMALPDDQQYWKSQYKRMAQCVKDAAQSEKGFLHFH